MEPLRFVPLEKDLIDAALGENDDMALLLRLRVRELRSGARWVPFDAGDMRLLPKEAS